MVVGADSARCPAGDVDRRRPGRRPAGRQARGRWAAASARRDTDSVLPGIDVHAAFDTHTFGSMWLSVQATEGPEGRYILAGDNVYVYENLEGADGDGVMRPIGLAFDVVRSVNAMVEMLQIVEGRARQVVPVHEALLPQVFPSRETCHGLQVTEIGLGDGSDSYVS